MLTKGWICFEKIKSSSLQEIKFSVCVFGTKQESWYKLDTYILGNCIVVVMVSILTSNVVDHFIETSDYKIGICYISAKAGCLRNDIMC